MSEFEPAELSTALIAGLAIEADKLADAALHLREAFRFSRQLKFIIAGFLILLAGLIWVALVNLSNGAAIRSCTTPTGDCYTRSQQQTSRAVAEIVSAVNAHTDQLVIATLQCSRTPLTDAQFAACLRSKGVR